MTFLWTRGGSECRCRTRSAVPREIRHTDDARCPASTVPALRESERQPAPRPNIGGAVGVVGTTRGARRHSEQQGHTTSSKATQRGADHTGVRSAHEATARSNGRVVRAGDSVDTDRGAGRFRPRPVCDAAARRRARATRGSGGERRSGAVMCAARSPRRPIAVVSTTADDGPSDRRATEPSRETRGWSPRRPPGPVPRRPHRAGPRARSPAMRPRAPRRRDALS